MPKKVTPIRKVLDVSTIFSSSKKKSLTFYKALKEKHISIPDRHPEQVTSSSTHDVLCGEESNTSSASLTSKNYLHAIKIIQSSKTMGSAHKKSPRLNEPKFSFKEDDLSRFKEDPSPRIVTPS